MDTNISGVYAIVNTVTGSLYVGSAICISRRWSAHRHALRNHKKSPPKLQAAWDKYGESAFEFRVLETCAADLCLETEQRYIDALSPKYNTRAEAKSNLGLRWTAETNAKKGRPEMVFTVQGVSGGLHTLCKHFGIVTKQCAQWRMSKKGMSVEDAVLTPPASMAERGAISAKNRAVNDTNFKGSNVTFRGVTGSVAALARQFSPVGYYTVRSRLTRGWPLEAALLTPHKGKKPDV